ncbi:peptidase P60 [Actinomyces lilanjuaniae]|uniref:Peptidase P60 n=1 Tax=Actinomyces lilanjuaniae TaxID=2321394 RepID=A0ABN5PMG4_9ACTO|nr:NlpC/P60 family protein [Actinomyces lilanjuaniae]AYD89184.1 peptidase P60 [Actinomyces lilanjuaniae]
MRTLAAGTAALLLVLAWALLATTSPAPAEGGAVLASDKVPEAYRDLVNQAGTTCEGITPGIIAAQVSQESGWDPDAASPAGAQGISQFMPATWATSGGDHNGDGTADVWDPADAIPSQAAYMCALLAAVDAATADGTLPDGSDRVALALAAYNAGLGAVLDHGGIPPYPETQHYVEVIQASAADYETTTGSGAADGDIDAAISWARSIADDDTNTYVWGGEGPTGWDCSGLTRAFMARLGVSVEHKADAQARDPQGTTIDSLEQARPGDLLFWGDSGYYHHVAIYTGAGQMISADSEATGINDEPIWGTVTLIRRLT